MIYVGIDPAFRQGGFAVCILYDGASDLTFKTFKNGLPDFLDWLFADAPSGATWAIENSNLQKVLFSRLATKKQAMDVGKNMAASVYTSELIRRHDTTAVVIDVSPKDKGTKLTHAAYVQVSRQSGIEPMNGTNQDQRDAFKLALIARRMSRINL